MGTPDFALESLKALVENASHTIACVYTQPPRPAGRGQKLVPSPVQQYAESQGIEVRSPTSLKTPEEQKKFHALKADLAIVAAYGLILPQAILDSPKLGCVNVHGSLLPRWRGAAPIQRSIEAGDRKTGITLMQMELGLDTGPMIAFADLPIQHHDNAQTIHDSLAEIGGGLLVACLEKILEGKMTAFLQSEDGVTYAHKLEKSEGKLDWAQPAETLHHKMRALTPWPGVWFSHGDIRIKVKDASFISEESSAKPGTVLNDQLHIACSEGTFCPTLLQKEGGKPMPIGEFLRGYKIPKGTYLS